MKIAPILRAARKIKRLKSILIHTGQHYDRNMSDAFFKDLNISKPHECLNVGSDSHGAQTAKILSLMEKALIRRKPDWVVVVGDVNSTMAAALAASKLGIKVAHVEAGMRSYDRSMPEEINRILTDRLSDVLFTTEKNEGRNLIKEGIERSKIFQVGDVMVDSLYYGLKRGKVKKVKLLTGNGAYAVLTLHRAGNVDDARTLTRIVKAVNRVAKQIKVYFPVHPRTFKQIKKANLKFNKNIMLMKPLGYYEFANLYRRSKFVMTDSGGLQLETSVLNIPCLTLRDNTERPTTLFSGSNTLVSSDSDKILKEVDKIIRGKGKKSRLLHKWDGRASERILKVLLSYREERKNV